MKILSVKTLRLLGLASISMVLALGLSCKKDEAEPNPTNNSGSTNNNGNNTLQPIIATADINFVDDGETMDFKSHNMLDFVEFGYSFIDDSLYVFTFKSTNQYGSEIDGPIIQLVIVNPIEGVVYDLSNGIDLVRVFYNDNLYEEGSTGTAEIQFSSLHDGNVKGTFEFIAYSQNDPIGEKVIVSNGEFEGKLGADN